MKRNLLGLRPFFREFPFGVLLLATFTMIVGAPLAVEVTRALGLTSGPVGLAPFTVLLTVASSFAVWNLAPSRAWVIGAAGGILVLLGLSNVELSRLGLHGIVAPHTFNVVHVLTQTLFLVYVTLTILRTVFRARIVDGNILCGAACVYLMAGILWGYGYTMLELLVPGSFSVVAPDMAPHVEISREPGWLVYFSFTTLTTVGFGDVLPAKALARSLAVFEAVVGQIMLVVMMARLVGLHVAHTTSKKPEHATFSVDER